MSSLGDDPDLRTGQGQLTLQRLDSRERHNSTMLRNVCRQKKKRVTLAEFNVCVSGLGLAHIFI